jgi:hypothetical protein
MKVGGRVRKLVVLLSGVCRHVPDVKQFICSDMVKSLTEKQIAVSTAYELYITKKGKSNLVVFNKAVLQFSAFRLKVPEQSIVQTDLLRQILIGLQPALLEHRDLQNSKAKASEEELKHVFEEASKVAGGLKNGVLWKAPILDTWSIEQVLDHAALEKPHGLLHGPGSRVSAVKTEIDVALNAYKVECTKWGIDKFDETLLAEATRLTLLSQVTSYESQLARSLMKPLNEQFDSISKYRGLYAHVPPREILPQLLKKSTEIFAGRK